MRAPGHSIELIEYKAPAQRGRVDARPCDAGFAHIAFDVDDVDAVLEAVRPHGVDADLAAGGDRPGTEQGAARGLHARSGRHHDRVHRSELAARRRTHGREATRHHHARRHRTHGRQPASRALDRGDPRAGRRRARGRHARHARPDPRRAASGCAARAREGARHRARRRPTSTRRSRTRPTPCSSTRLRRSSGRRSSSKAIAAGKHVYCEKPTATNLAEALDLYRAAKAAGVKHGVVQDKLWLPGLLKLKMLIDSGFFGRILSVRGEFGYWVFEGDWQAGAAPVVELPQGGRRRDHPRHAVPLALRARQPVRRGEGGELPRRHAHPRALGRGRQALPGDRRRRGVRDASARGRRRSRR